MPNRATPRKAGFLAPAPNRTRLGNVKVETGRPGCPSLSCRSGITGVRVGAVEPARICFVLGIEGITVNVYAPERPDPRVPARGEPRSRARDSKSTLRRHLANPLLLLSYGLYCRRGDNHSSRDRREIPRSVPAPSTRTLDQPSESSICCISRGRMPVSRRPSLSRCLFATSLALPDLFSGIRIRLGKLLISRHLVVRMIGDQSEQSLPTFFDVAFAQTLNRQTVSQKRVGWDPRPSSVPASDACVFFRPSKPWIRVRKVPPFVAVNAGRPVDSSAGPTANRPIGD